MGIPQGKEVLVIGAGLFQLALQLARTAQAGPECRVLFAVGQQLLTVLLGLGAQVQLQQCHHQRLARVALAGFCTEQGLKKRAGAAGLGALRVDTRIEDGTGAALLELQWERGANPLLHRARASSIGDAWELAPSHARDLEEVLAPLKLAKQAEPVRKANIATCEQRFGRVSVAGRAASMFVPLSPEAIDPSDDAPRPAPQPQPQPNPGP